MTRQLESVSAHLERLEDSAFAQWVGSGGIAATMGNHPRATMLLRLMGDVDAALASLSLGELGPAMGFDPFLDVRALDREAP